MVVPQPLRIPCRQDAKGQQQTCQHGTRLMAGELGPWPRLVMNQWLKCCLLFRPKTPRKHQGNQHSLESSHMCPLPDPMRYKQKIPPCHATFPAAVHLPLASWPGKITGPNRVSPRPAESAEGPHPLQSIAGSARRWSRSSKPSTAIVDPQGFQGFPLKKPDLFTPKKQP